MKTGVVDLDADLFEDEIMSENDGNNEELEALIKQRVKEGSGKDYESIIKKDVTVYQK